ncbi:MAG: DUF1501 domain-containing protein, partial [Verrucomicrobiae bacterium]|nr:DUF1501 domain-containing protein [Verrucomicrobiae bacterium]NNJ85933.1 DUF1501 domain-containing protein [Akkermansiaceae bacterium]
MSDQSDFSTRCNRRAFLGTVGNSFGAVALSSLLGKQISAAGLGAPFHAPKAKRVIYLFQSGGPSHVDLFDGKPSLVKNHGAELPDEVRDGQRVTGMTSGQKNFPVLRPLFGGKQCGDAGIWLSDLLPYTQKIADKICLVRSMQTEAINHDPAVTLINTGSMQLGHASLGAWLSYGLGNENENLPAYMVLLSQGTGKNPGQPIFSRLWGSGYLPSEHQGVLLRSGSDPVLYLDNPKGVDRHQRRNQLDTLAALNHSFQKQNYDPETLARISAYEMAYRMQASVPELTDLKDEPDSTFELYGKESRRPGSYAANCLLARRLVERGSRFVQLFHRGWDQHSALKAQLPNQCLDTDQPSAALIQDLEQRGLLDETLVIWGGEFGRTVYSQGNIN